MINITGAFSTQADGRPISETKDGVFGKIASVVDIANVFLAQQNAGHVLEFESIGRERSSLWVARLENGRPMKLSCAGVVSFDEAGAAFTVGNGMARGSAGQVSQWALTALSAEMLKILDETTISRLRTGVDETFRALDKRYAASGPASGASPS